MDPQKLSRQQVELVLRRAAEIEAGEIRGEGESSEQSLAAAELVRLGEEAGLGPDAVMRAIAELRHGSLRPEEKKTLSRTLGPSRLVVSREVPGPVSSVQRAVERFLREQLMTIRRHHGERIQWERAQGLWPGLARSLDFARRYALAPVSRVETTVIPEGEAMTSVTFDIDLSEMRRHRLTRVLLRASAAFALVGLGGSAVLPGFGPADIVALFSGGAAAGGFFAFERQRFAQVTQRVALAPERFLDLLVQRRKRASERSGSITPSDEEPGEGSG